MPQTKQLKQCLTSPTWYECPIPLTIFVIFFILFIYSILVLMQLTGIIKKATEKTQEEFENETGHTLKQYTQAYVLNIIFCFLSLLVLVFFVYKSIPEDIQEGAFSGSIGIAVLVILLILSSWNIHVFRMIKKQTSATSTVVASSAIILTIVLVAIILIGFEIYKARATMHK